MIEKILRFLPIYIILGFIRYFTIIIQFPFSYIRSKIIRRNFYKINDSNDQHKYILVYACYQKNLQFLVLIYCKLQKKMVHILF